ncbi:hypothetical protein VTO42DRAFT_8884 [Malbranchea cinnamomea]
MILRRTASAVCRSLHTGCDPVSRPGVPSLISHYLPRLSSSPARPHPGRFWPPFATIMTESQSQSQAHQQQHWASHPFSLITDTGLSARPEVPRDHAVVQFTQNMALVHNLILRGLNAAYNQCLDVSPGTQAAHDFLVFNQCIFQVLQVHHDMEEQHLFPALEAALDRPGAMDQNRQEHHSFHDELMRFHEYVFGTDPKDYDGETLKAAILALGPLVEKHLHNEVAPLYDLHRIESTALKSLWKTVQQNHQPDFDMYRHVPFMITCADNAFVLDGRVAPFPAFPAFVGHLVKFFLGRKHSGVWEFSPSDFTARLKPRARTSL